jgi:hypothetical protein
MSELLPKEYNLGFISDHDTFHHVQETVRKYRFQIDLKTFNKNLIDPIKYLGDDWSVPPSKWDIVNQSQQIYVEMKNKHNTMDSFFDVFQEI